MSKSAVVALENGLQVMNVMSTNVFSIQWENSPSPDLNPNAPGQLGDFLQVFEIHVVF